MLSRKLTLFNRPTRLSGACTHCSTSCFFFIAVLSLIVFTAVFVTWNQIYSYDIIFIPQHSNGELSINAEKTRVYYLKITNVLFLLIQC